MIGSSTIIGDFKSLSHSLETIREESKIAYYYIRHIRDTNIENSKEFLDMSSCYVNNEGLRLERFKNVYGQLEHEISVTFKEYLNILNSVHEKDVEEENKSKCDSFEESKEYVSNEAERLYHKEESLNIQKEAHFDFSLRLDKIINEYKESLKKIEDESEQEYKNLKVVVQSIQNEIEKNENAIEFDIRGNETKFVYSDGYVSSKLDIELLSQYPDCYVYKEYLSDRRTEDGNVYIDHDHENENLIVKYMEDEESLIKDIQKKTFEEKCKLLNDLEWFALPVKQRYVGLLAYDDDNIKMNAWRNNKILVVNEKKIPFITEELRKSGDLDKIFGDQILKDIVYDKETESFIVDYPSKLKYADIIEDFFANNRQWNTNLLLKPNLFSMKVCKEIKIGIQLSDDDKNNLRNVWMSIRHVYVNNEYNKVIDDYLHTSDKLDFEFIYQTNIESEQRNGNEGLYVNITLKYPNVITDFFANHMQWIGNSLMIFGFHYKDIIDDLHKFGIMLNVKLSSYIHHSSNHFDYYVIDDQYDEDQSDNDYDYRYSYHHYRDKQQDIEENAKRMPTEFKELRDAWISVRRIYINGQFNEVIDNYIRSSGEFERIYNNNNSSEQHYENEYLYVNISMKSADAITYYLANNKQWNEQLLLIQSVDYTDIIEDLDKIGINLHDDNISRSYYTLGISSIKENKDNCDERKQLKEAWRNVRRIYINHEYNEVIDKYIRSQEKFDQIYMHHIDTEQMSENKDHLYVNISLRYVDIISNYITDLKQLNGKLFIVEGLKCENIVKELEEIGYFSHYYYSDEESQANYKEALLEAWVNVRRIYINNQYIEVVDNRIRSSDLFEKVYLKNIKTEQCSEDGSYLYVNLSLKYFDIISNYITDPQNFNTQLLIVKHLNYMDVIKEMRENGIESNDRDSYYNHYSNHPLKNMWLEVRKIYVNGNYNQSLDDFLREHDRIFDLYIKYIESEQISEDGTFLYVNLPMKYPEIIAAALSNNLDCNIKLLLVNKLKYKDIIDEIEAFDLDSFCYRFRYDFERQFKTVWINTRRLYINNKYNEVIDNYLRITNEFEYLYIKYIDTEKRYKDEYMYVNVSIKASDAIEYYLSNSREWDSKLLIVNTLTYKHFTDELRLLEVHLPSDCYSLERETKPVWMSVRHIYISNQYNKVIDDYLHSSGEFCDIYDSNIDTEQRNGDEYLYVNISMKHADIITSSLRTNQEDNKALLIPGLNLSDVVNEVKSLRMKSIESILTKLWKNVRRIYINNQYDQSIDERLHSSNQFESLYMKSIHTEQYDCDKYLYVNIPSQYPEVIKQFIKDNFYLTRELFLTTKASSAEILCEVLKVQANSSMDPLFGKQLRHLWRSVRRIYINNQYNLYIEEYLCSSKQFEYIYLRNIHTEQSYEGRYLYINLNLQYGDVITAFLSKQRLPYSSSRYSYSAIINDLNSAGIRFGKIKSSKLYSFLMGL